MRLCLKQAGGGGGRMVCFQRPSFSGNVNGGLGLNSMTQSMNWPGRKKKRGRTGVCDADDLAAAGSAQCVSARFSETVSREM